MTTATPTPTPTVRLKDPTPRAVAGYDGTADQPIYDAWKGRRVEPYGRLIPGYGDIAPFDADHVPVRLAIPGAAAFSVVNLDEIDGPLDLSTLPSRPSHSGTPGIVYSPDNARGY